MSSTRRPTWVTPQPLRTGILRLSCELNLFRRWVLPLFVERHRLPRQPFERAVALLADDAGELFVSLVSETPPGRAPQPVPSAEVRDAVRAAHVALFRLTQRNLLADRPVADVELPCCDLNDGLSWWLTPLVEPWSQSRLDHEARALAESLGCEAGGAFETHHLLTQTPTPTLLEALRGLDFNTFMRRAETLLRLYPEGSERVFALPASRRRPTPFAGWYNDVSGITSYLLGCLMMVRANNHFGLVRRAARRPASVGAWSPYALGQVLHVLHRKWMVVHELAARERGGTEGT